MLSREFFVRWFEMEQERETLRR